MEMVPSEHAPRPREKSYASGLTFSLRILCC
jgi:hypothetical protein